MALNFASFMDYVQLFYVFCLCTSPIHGLKLYFHNSHWLRWTRHIDSIPIPWSVNDIHQGQKVSGKKLLFQVGMDGPVRSTGRRQSYIKTQIGDTLLQNDGIKERQDYPIHLPDVFLFCHHSEVGYCFCMFSSLPCFCNFIEVHHIPTRNEAF